MLLGDLAVLMRIDDDKAFLVVLEMPFDQWQGAFADRPKTDHDNGAGNLGMDWRGGGRGHWLWTPGDKGNHARSARSGNEGWRRIMQSLGNGGLHLADECQAVNSVGGLP